MSVAQSPSSQKQLGDNYFLTRGKLQEAIHALAQLCEIAEVDAGRIAMLRSLVANLKHPFLFVVAGEVNSGKSTLLNALFGENFCSTDVIPSTDRIVYFKHGVEPHEFEFSDEILEVYRPNNFLKEFNLVDTPGTNSIAPNHESITQQFLPSADLILFVFSATNPWGQATWDFLDRIDHQWRKNIVFILQQCDLRSEEEITAILAHLQKTAADRYDKQFPTFAISAKQAFHAKINGVSLEALDKFSNIEALEHHISSVVESSDTHLTKMINALQTCRQELEEIKANIGSASNIIAADNRLLSEIEPAVNVQIDRTIEKCEPMFVDLENRFMAVSRKTASLIDGQFRILAALKSAEKCAKEIQTFLYATTIQAVRHHVNTGLDTIEEDIGQLYDRIAYEMQNEFNLPLDSGTEELRPDWTNSRIAASNLVENATAEILDAVNLKQELTKRFRKRNLIVWSLISLSLLAVAAGVAMTLLDNTPLNAIMFAVAGVTFGITAIAAFLSIKNIREFYISKLQEQSTRLLETQRHSFGLGAKQFFNDFVRFFDPIRTVCQEHRVQFQPQIDQVEIVENHLVQLEKTLNPAAKILATKKE